MASIVTVTFSPCIDKSTTVDLFVPEIKMHCGKAKLEPGGGGINVARAIHQLGSSAAAIYPAGGYTGRFFTALLNQDNIVSIIVETNQETRENFVVLETSTNRQYRFGMPGTALQEMEWQQMLQRLEAFSHADYIIASGSLPPGVPAEVYARIAQIAKANNARLIVDTGGQALRYALAEGVYLIKPNLGELAQLTGKTFLEQHEILPAAQQLIENYHCTAVVVSMGGEGALLVTKDMAAKVVPPAVQRKSTVGAGDSMVAGMVIKLSKGETLLTAAQYGVACGTAATLNPGTALCKYEDAEKIFAQVQTVII